MTNGWMGKFYIDQAAYHLEDARRDHQAGRHNMAVRRAQECVELCIKGLARLLGVEVPKVHDAGAAFTSGRGAMPAWLAAEADRLAAISAWLAKERGPAFYGKEEEGIPAPHLYGQEHGARAVADATHVQSLATRLLAQWDALQEPPPQGAENTPGIER